MKFKKDLAEVQGEVEEAKGKNKMLMIEREEKENCIGRLREVTEEKEETIEGLTREIKRLADRLCTAESQLFEMQSQMSDR